MVVISSSLLTTFGWSEPAVRGFQKLAARSIQQSTLAAAAVGSNQANILQKYRSSEPATSSTKSGCSREISAGPQDSRMVSIATLSSMWRKAMLKPLTLCSVVASSILAGLNPAGSSRIGSCRTGKSPVLVRAIDELKADKLVESQIAITMTLAFAGSRSLRVLFRRPRQEVHRAQIPSCT